MEIFANDVSEFQVPADDSYPYQWLIFRAFDGDHTDKNFAANLAWAQKAKAAGKLKGFTVYFVYNPGYNHVNRLDGMGVPRDCHLMIDVESWGSRISGNRSNELNALADKLAARQGSQDRVWGYANGNDFIGLWPTRPSWLNIVVASYGSQKPNLPRMVGWQYSDGELTFPAPAGYPRSTKPFGACDHNRLYLPDTEERSIVMDAETKAYFDKMFGMILRSPDPTHPYALDTILNKVNGLYNLIHTLPGAIQAQQVNVSDLASALATELGPDMAKELADELSKRLAS